MELIQTNEILILLILAAAVGVVVFFLITLQNTLKLIMPPHRTLQPGLVWLQLTPVFGLIWSFVIVNAIGKSAKAQMAEYGVFYDDKSTSNVGFGWAVCQVLSLLIGFFSVIAIVMFLSYWIKVNELRKQLLLQKQLFENKEEGSIL